MTALPPAPVLSLVDSTSAPGSASGTCYDATFKMHGTVGLSLFNNELVPAIKADQPKVDVHVPWYCWFAAALGFGWIGVWVTKLVDDIFTDMAKGLAQDALKKMLGSNIPDVSLQDLFNATFNSVAISSEGINIQGNVYVPVPESYAVPTLGLSGSVITTQSQEVGSGIFNAKPWCKDEAKDYPYTEYLQHQKGVYQCAPKMVVRPLTLNWTVSSGATTIPLTGGSGTIELPNVTAQYPMPLSTGGIAVQQKVHIGYSISGTGVQLTNLPNEGAYGFYLHVSATVPETPSRTSSATISRVGWRCSSKAST